MSRHRYRGMALSWDYLRAGTGLAFTAGPVLLLEPMPAVAVVLSCLALLFVVFAVRTGLRHLTVIEVSAEGIAARGPFSCSIPWREVTRLRLDYFSIGRERERGWMQLKVSSRFRRLRVDSTIDRFAELASAAAKFARDHAVPIADSTAANFHALGIEAGGEREVAA